MSGGLPRRRRPGPVGFGRDGRGQLVLLAGVVVAVAFAGMLLAYLQLGYHADVETADDSDRTVRDAESLLDRGTHAVARDLRGEYAWSQRADAVDEMRARLDPYRQTLEATRAESGVVADATFNGSAAGQWASDECPGGSGREFGPCRADRGVVVQERDGRTLVLAVAFDLTVVTERQTTNLTVVETTG